MVDGRCTESHHNAGKPSQLSWDSGLSTFQQFPFVLVGGNCRHCCKYPITPLPLACSCCGTGSCSFAAASSLSAPSEEKTTALLKTVQVCLDKGHLFLCVAHSYGYTSQNRGSEALRECHSHVQKVQVHASGYFGKLCCQPSQMCTCM